MSLVSGPLPIVLTTLGIVAVILLAAFPPSRKWWWRALLVMIGAAVLVYVLNLLMEHVWRPFPDPLDFRVLGWVWALFTTLGLLTWHLLKKRWFAIGAALVAIVAALAGINYQFAYFPDVKTALGMNRPETTDLTLGRVDEVAAPPGGYLSDVWRPTSYPAGGTLSRISIPGSGFAAREALIYLPPAYQAVPRPLLPVLVLLSGQPGAPQMWIDGGRLVEAMDGYAKAHHGLAPIVVLPDVLGSELGNPLCVDSPRGNVETYLARDVPDWVHANLQVATGPEHWAIGGLSFGGTCALQLALRAPNVYGRFIDISGDRELELHTKQEAVDEVFGGDAARYAQHNPPDILATQRFPNTAARLVVGRDDGQFTVGMRTLAQEARAAGMDVSVLELPGGHSWAVWRPGLEQSLPWLATQTRLARQ